MLEADAYHRVTLGQDGRRVAEFFPAPAFYDEPGQGFVPIDLTLEATSSSEGTSEPPAWVRPVRGPQEAARLATKVAPGEPTVVVGTTAGLVRVRQPEVKAQRTAEVESGKVGKKGSQGKEKVSPQDPQAEGDPALAPRPAVKVKDVLTEGRDLITEPTTDGFKQSVVLHDLKGKASYETEFELPAGVTARQADGAVSFLDAAGAVVGRFGGGLAFDSAGPVPAETPVLTRLVKQTGTRALLVSEVDRTWLRAAERVLPVTIDPTFTQTMNSPTNSPECGTPSPFMPCDTYINSDNYTGRYSLQTELRTGSPGSFQQGSTTVRNDTISYIKFTTDNIGTSCFSYNVTSATLRLTAYAGSGSTETFYARRLTASPTDTTDWNARASMTSTLTGQASLSKTGTGTLDFPVTAIANAWWNGTANHGFQVTAANPTGVGTPSAAGFRQYRSGNSSLTTAPRLTVEYDAKAPPCAVQNPTATGRSLSADLQWSAATGDGGSPVTSYTISTYRDGVFVKSESVTAPRSTYTVTGLPAATGYSFHIAPVNAVGTGPVGVTNTVTVTAPNSPPPAPQASSPADGAVVASATPTLAVGAVSDPQGDAVSYRFQVATADTFITTVADSQWQTGASWTVPSGALTPGARYFWRAWARDTSLAESAKAFTRSFTVNSPPAGAVPTSPDHQGTVASTTPQLVVGTATDPQGQQVTYRFEVSASNTFATVLADSDFTTAAAYTVPAGRLVTGSTYFWRVATRDSLGATTGSPFVRSFTVREPPPQQPPAVPTVPAPADMSIIPSAPDALSVKYSDPDGDAGTVTLQLTSVDSGQPIATMTSASTASGGVASVAGTVAQPALVKSLVDGKYRWTAQAKDALGNTSGTATFTFEIRSSDALLGYGGRNGWAGPVNTATGNFVHTGTDVVLNTAGPELSAARVYNSLTTRNTGYGIGWTHTFGVRWTGEPGGNIAIDWADGRREVHTRSASNTFTAPKGYYSQLVADGGGYRLTLKDRSVFAFGGDGRLTSVTDASGRQLQLTYTPAGLDRVTDPSSGRFLDFDVDGGLIRSVSTPAVAAHGGALTWRYGYTNGRLTSVCAPDSTDAQPVCWRYGYDSTSGLLVSAVTPRGNADTTVRYLSDGRVEWTENGAADRTTFAYAGGGEVRVTDGRSNTTVQRHDAELRLVSETDPSGATTSYGYDSFDNRTSITDGLGQTATLTYDQRANPLTITNPAGETTYSTFTADLLTGSRDGRSSSATDPAFLTEYGYDSRRNRTSETSPATADHGRITRTWTFSTGVEPALGGGTVPAGLELTATDGRGKTTTFTYDRLGDLRERRDASGLTTSFTYDELGRKLTETVTDADASAEARQAASGWTYDTHSNVATVTGPAVRNSVSAVVHQARTTHTYDRNDNLLTEVHADLGAGVAGDPTRTVRHEFDAADREFRTVDADGGVTLRTFDAAGNPDSVTDAEGRRYTLSYDSRNLPDVITLRGFVQDPIAGSTPRDLVVADLGHDDAGRRTTVTDALGRVTRTDYDRADRPTATVRVGYRDLSGTRRDVTLSATTYDRAGHPTRSTVGGPRNPQVTTSTYDNAGWLTSSTLDPDALARLTRFTRDRAGNETVRTLTAAGSSRSEQVRSVYDDAARLVEQTTENGTVDLTVRYGYDQRGNPIRSTDPRGTTAGATAAQVEAFTTTVDFDALSRPFRTTAPPVGLDDGTADTVSDSSPAPTGRPTVTTGFDTWGNPTHSTDARGNLTVTRYDVLDRRIEVRHPAAPAANGDGQLLPTETFAYDKVGNLLSQTSRRGQTSQWRYDALNRAVSQTDPAANPAGSGTDSTRGISRSSYDDVGNLLELIDPTGAVSRSGYDDLDRVRTATQVVRDPDGTGPASGGQFTTVTDYDDQGHVVLTRGATVYPGRQDDPATAVDERYAVSTFTVNAAGETTRTVDATGAASSTDYDLAGRPVTVTDPIGRRATTEYDLAGRATVHRRFAADGTLLTTSSTAFDPAGNPVAATSPRGTAAATAAGSAGSAAADRFTTRRSYDALNRLLQVTVPVDSSSSTDLVTRYGYDAAGNHTRTIDGRGQQTRSTYQSWNLPAQTVEPATAAHSTAADRTWSFGYDAGGLPIRETQPGGVQVERGFDALARPVSETASGPDAPQASRTFGYDLAGRRTAVDHPDGAIALRYDDRSLLVASAGGAGSAAFGYDNDGRMTTRQDAAGTTTYRWNARSELVGAADGLSGQDRTWAFDPAGQLKQMTSSGGIRRSYAHDSLGRLVSDSQQAADGTVRASQRYGYDVDGNLREQTVEFPAPPLSLTDPVPAVVATNLAEGRHAYCYDNAGRLTRWDKPLPTDALSPDDTDDCGPAAALTDTADVTDYAYDPAGNRLTAGAQSWTYDERSRLATGPAGSYTWTARGTMASSTDGAQARTYTFDGLGRQTAAGGVTYAFDGLDRIATRSVGADPNSSGTGSTAGGGVEVPTSARFAYAGTELDPVDDQVETAATSTDLGSRYARSPAGRLLALVTNGGAPRQVLANRHGDLTALTDSTGQLTDTKLYDPYGQTSVDTTTGLTGTNAGYQGDWTDPTTNQVWMGARFYQPANAGFTRRDAYAGELSTPVSLNRYTYAHNNPLLFIDPDGRRVVVSDGQDSAEQGAQSLAVSHRKRSASQLNSAYTDAQYKGITRKIAALAGRSLSGRDAAFVEYARSVAISDANRPRTALAQVLRTLQDIDIRHTESASDTGFFGDLYNGVAGSGAGVVHALSDTVAFAGDVQSFAIAHSPLGQIPGVADFVEEQTERAEALLQRGEDAFVRFQRDKLGVDTNSSAYNVLDNVTQIALPIGTAGKVGKAGVLASKGRQLLGRVTSKFRGRSPGAAAEAGGARFVAGADGVTDLVGKAPNAISLGHYPAYTQMGGRTGARTFSMSDEAWNAMSPHEQWVRNQRFLDRAIAGGSEIRLATPIDAARPGSFFERELQYLIKRGYGPNGDGTMLVPGPR